MGAKHSKSGITDQTVGVRIREVRQRVGLTIQELASKARCSRNYVAGLERGMSPGRSTRARGSVERILVVLDLAVQQQREAGDPSDELAEARA